MGNSGSHRSVKNNGSDRLKIKYDCDQTLTATEAEGKFLLFFYVDIYCSFQH